MGKDKDKSINPAAQQRKLEKAKALKKSRAELQSRRNEKLARRNPDRIQRQIDDLKALEAAGDIKPREKAILEELERDIRSIRKAREALGDQAPRFGDTRSNRKAGENNNVLGKRKHDGERKNNNPRHYSSGSDTDDSVRRIPMPEDTPPPIPREYRRNYNHNKNPNLEPLNNNNHNNNNNNYNNQNILASTIPPTEARTTYESAPQIRDLKKEAISKFVPSVVRRKQEAVKGTGNQLVEPEELDRLEAQGYLRSDVGRSSVQESNDQAMDPEAKRLAAEEERFQREIEMGDADSGGGGEEMVDSKTPQTPDETQLYSSRRQVEIEEVEDEDG